MRAGSRRSWRRVVSTEPAGTTVLDPTTGTGASAATTGLGTASTPGAGAGRGAGARAGCRCGCCCRRGGGVRGSNGRAGACEDLAASCSSFQALRSSSHGEGGTTGGSGGGAADVWPVCLRQAASRKRCSSGLGGGAGATPCLICQFSHSHLTNPARTAMTMIAT